MKVVTPNQMSDIESLAYKDGASDSEFMEEAGSGVALFVQDYVERHNLDRVAILLCGKGNNAGDAYVAGIQLLHLEYEVFAIQPVSISECSRLCRQNNERFIHEGGRTLKSLEDFPANGIIIDGIFGTGFKGKVSEPFLSLIRAANESHMAVISIDIPSGLNGETGIVESEAVLANETVFLGLPKKGFFLNDGWNYIGKLRYVDFGLSKEYIEGLNTDIVMVTSENASLLLPEIVPNRHKYQAGYVVGLAGSPEMPGAAILSSTAALRGGAGIVRLFYPDGMREELVAAPYELICTSYRYDDTSEILAQMDRASAVFIGPGLGRTEAAKQLLQKILPQIQKPCVIDADALYFIAGEEIALPSQTVLTPHHGEMMRLLGGTGHPELTQDFLKKSLDYAIKKKVTIALKGGPTFILQEGSPMFVNHTGDPGMATAGSGDVLTGLIASFLAQGCTPIDAACLGVFLHGLAGEYAAEDMTSYGLCATDIIYRFPEAFKALL
jgi:ADP-dependent NAD(P)H-hydrate dehydratase / NAD(P)H-hydrate epimerase